VQDTENLRVFQLAQELLLGSVDRWVVLSVLVPLLVIQEVVRIVTHADTVPAKKKKLHSAMFFINRLIFFKLPFLELFQHFYGIWFQKRQTALQGVVNVVQKFIL
jgi:hypothetical protein